MNRLYRRCDHEPSKRLIFVAGKRKAGTTFLFHSLDVASTPINKDRNWPETRAQISAFLEGPAPNGIVAKAEAIYDAPRLLQELAAAEATEDNTHIIVLDRDPYDRFLSFLAHARKLRWRPVTQELQAFQSEETVAEAGYALLQTSPFPLSRVQYEDLNQGAVAQVAGFDLRPVTKRSNARAELLPFFNQIAWLVERPAYTKLRETRVMTALKQFYYKYMARRTKHQNGFVRSVTLGSVAGTADGQRRITGIFTRNTSFRNTVLDYNGHRRWWGPLQIVAQMLQSAWLGLFGHVDVVYLALSRTPFGLIRDALLLSLLRCRGARVVAHVHGAEFETFYFDRSKLAWLKAHQLASIDSFIFLHAALLPAQPEIVQRAQVLINPLPAFAQAALVQSDTKPHSLHRPPVLGFISSFIPDKGVEDFLDAANGLADQAQFKVAGGVHGAFQSYGKQIQARIAASPSVAYMGFLDDPSTFYAGVDFVVFPTRYASEALPGVVLEALAFGCIPIVRRTNQLSNIFQTAPIRWFGETDLDQTIAQALAAPDAQLLQEKQQAQAWIDANIPSEAAWIDQLERLLLNWPGQTRPPKAKP